VGGMFPAEVCCHVKNRQRFGYRIPRLPNIDVRAGIGEPGVAAPRSVRLPASARCWNCQGWEWGDWVR